MAEEIQADPTTSTRSGGDNGRVPSPTVLFVSHTAEFTGPTNSLFELVTRLRNRFRIGVLVAGDGPLVQRLEAANIKVMSLPHLRKWSIPSMVDVFRRSDVDLVYGNNTSGASKNALIAAKLASVPFIYHIRAMAGDGNWRKVAFLHFADAAISVSHATAASYGRYLPNRSYVVHNGVALPGLWWDRAAARQYTSAAVDAPGNAFFILAVGDITPRKAQVDAVRALAAVSDEVPTAHLLLAGRLNWDRGYVSEIRGLAQRFQLANRVHLLGFRRDTGRLMAGADLLIHTATEDPHPRAVLEAMAAGLPVVAYGVDGVNETVLDGRTGLLVSPGDTETLAGAILRLARDQQARDALGAAGRRQVEAHFTAEETARKVGDIVERTLAARRRS